MLINGKYFSTHRKDFSHPTTHASMATAVPQKNIDEINSLREMIDVFELLHIDCDEDKLNLKEMKKKAKEKIKEQSSNRTTVSVYFKHSIFVRQII